MEISFETNAAPAGSTWLRGRSPCVHVTISDGHGTIELPFTDIDALEAMRDAFDEAAREMLDATVKAYGQPVRADRLERGDRVVFPEGCKIDRALIETVVIDGTEVVLTFVNGEWIRMSRTIEVTVLREATLAAV